MELIWRQLSDEYSMSTIEYNDLMSEMARPIFKKFADSTEKIRDLAFRITKLFFEVFFQEQLLTHADRELVILFQFLGISFLLCCSVCHRP